MADNLNDCTPAVRTVNNGGCPAIRIVGGGGGCDNCVPDGGTTGQVLAKKSNADGDFEWVSGGGVPPVSSVNGKTGAVVLTSSDVGALPNTYTPPVSSVNSKTGAVTLSASDVGALPDTYTPPVTSVNGQTGAVSLAIPTVPTIDSSIDNASSNSDTAGAKAVYDAVHPATGSSQPAGGFAPNIVYNLGTLSGNTTFALATPADANIANHYFWTFDTPATAPTITWPAGITSWYGGSAPTIQASKHYEVSVLNGVGIAMEV